ncbi:MAG: hypothetical protein U9P10_11250 [Thermodesulfobacteriota bacterium]|nr:hypothetical protein [Thermodesulfobacteriota bacterium]
MGKKKKKNTKHKKIAGMDCSQLEKEGCDHLASNNAIKAVQFLKSALKKAKDPVQKERIRAGLFESYLAREKQLKEKSMMDEAREVFQLAMENLPKTDQITEETLALIISNCDACLACEHCSRFFDHHSPAPEFKKLLGEKLALENCWYPLDSLDNLSFLARDADLIKKAVDLMNQGDWEKAKDLMQPLPRSSPFFNLRMFCRAMVAFYEDNDADMVKALSMISKNSIFSKSAEVLLASVKTISPKDMPATAVKVKPDNPLLPVFYQNGFILHQEVESLIQEMEKKPYSTACTALISKLAVSIYPESPEKAVTFLVETIWSNDLYLSDNRIQNSYFEMTEKLINKKTEFLKSKINFMLPDNNELSNTARFIEMAEKEFSDPEELAIAKSQAVFSTIQSIRNNTDYNYSYRPLNSHDKKILGITEKNTSAILLETAYNALSIDNQNRALYQEVAETPYWSRNAKTIKEKIFILMCSAFPTDPYPFLQLATVYHRKNAYRKAENTLKKAKEIAPHDQRVLDKHVLSLLISADRNIGKKKFHLAWKDLEKADTFKSKNCNLLREEKKILCRIVEKPEIPIKVLKLKLETFSNFNRARILAILICDIEKAGKKNNLKKVNAKLASFFDTKKFKELTSSEAAALLMPMPEDWQLLFNHKEVLNLFLNNLKGLLKRLDDGDLIQVINQIIYPDICGHFIEELSDRIEKRAGNNQSRELRLEFYHASLANIKHPQKIVVNASVFYEIIDMADSDTESILKNAASILSKRSTGPFRRALENFDFEIIELIDPSWEDPFLPDFDEDFFPDMIPSPEGMESVSELFKMLDSVPDAFAKPMAKMMSKDIVSQAEELIDNCDLRGMPKGTIKNAKKELMVIPETVDMIEFINEFAKRFDLNLSKEARIFFLE